ncbi:MAG: endonuclease/exonuclease/phosphatase family protein [Nocardioidaceae bacterium]
MRPDHRSIAALATSALTALGALLVPAAVTSAEAKPINPDAPLTVMTRNLYLGADIQRPLRAVAGVSDPSMALVKLANANAVTRTVVDQTNFPRRSELLTREIAAHQPDLIALQEVALWRHGPLELDPAKVAVPNAQSVDYDFLQILVDDLATAGLDYTPVRVQQESDVEAPAFTGVPPAFTSPQDVRLTMRDVVLMRNRPGLTLSDTGGGNFADELVVPLAGKAMTFTRGFAWADVKVGAKKVRFINTHLEAFGSDHALAQAKELLAGPADEQGMTTIIACDCNSDPLDGRPSNGVERRAPYDSIVASGFTDQWLHWKPAADGWTSGLSERVNDTSAGQFDHRIDMIFARTPSGKPLDVTQGQVTGTQLTDRDPVTGLWPSDHGGVELTLSGKDS